MPWTQVAKCSAIITRVYFSFLAVLKVQYISDISREANCVGQKKFWKIVHYKVKWFREISRLFTLASYRLLPWLGNIEISNKKH